MVKKSKLISLIVCFMIFFSLTNVVNANIVKDAGKIYDGLISGITSLLLQLGDGVIHIVTSSVGESVTIDRLVFNEVEKVSIDYWNDLDDDNPEKLQKPIKAFMSPVVTKWYSIFQKITIVVYLIVLVYVGISVMISSTADKKSSYKELFVTWFTGIVILFMFPYVMKYIIYLNNAVVHTLGVKATESGFTDKYDDDGFTLADKNYFEVFGLYGKDEFLALLGTDEKSDMMILTRSAAKTGTDGEKSDITLALAYLILVGQMLAILIMYYKRAFMIAFLITIFPLVVMTYVLDKIKDKKSQSFGIWFKEFVVNVIVQMFHAVVYLLITGTGIKSYIDSGGKNFVFMILCIWFLFEGEKILRTIFNINSKAKTMEDLAASGALMLSATKGIGSVFKKSGNDVGNADDKKEVSEAENRIKVRKNRHKEENEQARAALDEKIQAGQSTESHGEFQGDSNEPNGVSEKQYDGQNAKDTVLVKAMTRRLKGGVVTRAVNFGAGAVGATLETGRVLADGKSKPGEVLGAISAGKSLGRTVATPLTKVTNKAEQIVRGQIVANNILKGKEIQKDIDGVQATIFQGNMDKELGINLLDNTPGYGFNVLGGEGSKQDVYRRALAARAKAAARGGEDAGEIAYYDYLEKNL